MTPHANAQNKISGKSVNFMQSDVYSEKLKTASNALLDVDDVKALIIVAEDGRLLEDSSKFLSDNFTNMENVTLFNISSTTTEKLIKKFNDIVGSVSLDTALRPEETSLPLNILMVNDAHLVHEDQWSLLSQLVNDFPGARIRFVLVVNRSEWSNIDYLVDKFKFDVHVCELSAIRLSSPQDILQIAEENGYKNEVEELLEGIAEKIENANHNDINDSSNLEHPNQRDQLISGTSLKSSKNQEQKLRDKKSWNWPLTSLVMTCLLFLTCFFALFKPTSLDDIRNELFTLLTLQTEDDLVMDDVTVEFEAPNKQNTKIFYDESLLVTKTIVNDQISAVISDHNNPSVKVLSSENSDYFIQHNAFKEMKGAENYLNSNPALKNAELINMVISNELHYVLLSGPFPSKESAQLHAMEPGMPQEFWVRSAEPLKDIINKTVL